MSKAAAAGRAMILPLALAQFIASREPWTDAGPSEPSRPGAGSDREHRHADSC